VTLAEHASQARMRKLIVSNFQTLDGYYESSDKTFGQHPRGVPVGPPPRTRTGVRNHRRQAGVFGPYSQTTRRESRTVVLVRSRLVSG
jgi:hypothetical protein